eukprot:5557955-Alexandrium_andersonii.AAC.1
MCIRDRLRVALNAETARQQQFLMEQSARQAQEAMEAIRQALEGHQAEERERLRLQERAEEYARSEQAQLLRNELIEADRARSTLQQEAFREAEQRLAERERESERQSERVAGQMR